jgi:hypothetical protein
MGLLHITKVQRQGTLSLLHASRVFEGLQSRRRRRAGLNTDAAGCLTAYGGGTGGRPEHHSARPAPGAPGCDLSCRCAGWGGWELWKPRDRCLDPGPMAKKMTHLNAWGIIFVAVQNDLARHDTGGCKSH